VPRNPLHAFITYGGQRQYHRWVNGTIPIANGLKEQRKPKYQKDENICIDSQKQRKKPI
jgi:hypothetical protein